jgi:hypothetical protein
MQPDNPLKVPPLGNDRVMLDLGTRMAQLSFWLGLIQALRSIQGFIAARIYSYAASGPSHLASEPPTGLPRCSPASRSAIPDVDFGGAVRY